MRTIGAAVSSVTVTELVPVFPFAVVPTATSMFTPSFNGTVAEKVLFVRVATTSLTLMELTPVPKVPVTATLSSFVIRPAAGVVIEICTGTLSTVNWTVPVPEFPARSLIVAASVT